MKKLSVLIFFTFLISSSITLATDFSGEEISPQRSGQWYEKMQLSGFAAAGFVQTGDSGAHGNGRFHIKESSLFVEADLNEYSNFYLEYQIVRLSAEKEKPAGQTGEVYLQFRNIFRSSGMERLGVKIGRIDLPFGEEYLKQDSSENPLVTTSVAWPYGFDEGLLLYGKTKLFDWIFAIMDGSDDRSTDDHASKAYNAKLDFNISEKFSLSASYLKNGNAKKSAFEFAGSHFESASGDTTILVDSNTFSIDSKISFDSFYFLLNYGQAEVNDNSVKSLDRNIKFYTFETLLDITNQTYIVFEI